MTDPAAIAAGLTKAQRSAIQEAIHREERGAWHPAGWYFNADRVRLNLSRMGLIHDYVPSWSRITPLGKRVRASLHDTVRGEGEKP